MNEKIVYNSPKENIEKEDDPIRTFDLFVDDKLIGRAEVTYYSKPFPFYQVDALYIENKAQGQGYGSKIMEQVEEFLKKRRKTGVIVDGILDGSPARGMYERRGWQAVPGTWDVFVYNLPNNFDIKDLKNYSARQLPVIKREGFKNKVKM